MHTVFPNTMHSDILAYSVGIFFFKYYVVEKYLISDAVYASTG